MNELLITKTWFKLEDGINSNQNHNWLSLFNGSGAARMRPKRPWPSRNKLAKIFTGALYQFSTVRK